MASWMEAARKDDGRKRVDDSVRSATTPDAIHLNLFLLYGCQIGFPIYGPTVWWWWWSDRVGAITKMG